MYFSPLEVHFCIMSTILNYTVHFVRAIVKPRKFYIQVSTITYVFVFSLVRFANFFVCCIFYSFFIDEGNQALQEFLAARNPRQQHSSTLESYLIKPIQRILKYPLLLQQLRNLTDSSTDEHQHLVGM